MATATKTDKTATETTTRCDAKKIAIGSAWSRHSYGTVTSRIGNRFTLRDEGGLEWDVDGANIMEAQFSFADQHTQEITDSRSKINEIIMAHPGQAMTICFKKKPEPKDVAKALASGQGVMSDRAWVKKVKDLSEGEERIMIGHHSGNVDEHQRLKFIESGKGPRLVDTRTTQFVVVDRTRYVVKS